MQVPVSINNLVGKDVNWNDCGFYMEFVSFLYYLYYLHILLGRSRLGTVHSADNNHSDDHYSVPYGVALSNHDGMSDDDHGQANDYYSGHKHDHSGGHYRYIHHSDSDSAGHHHHSGYFNSDY